MTEMNRKPRPWATYLPMPKPDWNTLFSQLIHNPGGNPFSTKDCEACRALWVAGECYTYRKEAHIRATGDPDPDQD